MKQSKRFPGGHFLTAETDMIEITDGVGHYEKDETWTYVDAAGHRHTWNSNTFTQISDEENWFDLDGYEYNGESHYECDICHERLAPSLIYKPPSAFRQFTPGMTHYTLTEITQVGGGRFEHSRNLTEEEALAWIEEHK